MCVYVCERKKERKRGGEGERERERKRGKKEREIMGNTHTYICGLKYHS